MYLTIRYKKVENTKQIPKKTQKIRLKIQTNTEDEKPEKVSCFISYLNLESLCLFVNDGLLKIVRYIFNRVVFFSLYLNVFVVFSY